MKCKSCNIEKNESAFYRTYKYTRYICKTCENRRLTIWRKKRAQKIKEEAVLYFGGKCSICGYSRCLKALEFHHRNDKKVGPSALIRDSSKLEQVLPELRKCILICANCHREHHAGVV